MTSVLLSINLVEVLFPAKGCETVPSSQSGVSQWGLRALGLHVGLMLCLLCHSCFTGDGMMVK